MAAGLPAPASASPSRAAVWEKRASTAVWSYWTPYSPASKPTAMRTGTAATGMVWGSAELAALSVRPLENTSRRPELCTSGEK